MTADDVRLLLRRRIREAGTQRELAVQMGVTPQYLSDVVNGKRAPGPAILAYFDLVAVVSYHECTPKSSILGKGRPY